MGILDVFRRSEPQPKPQILTKAPGFAVTGFTSNNPFTNLIEEESNYFDQNILYTAKAVDYRSSKVASSGFHLFDKEDKDTRSPLEKEIIYQDLKLFNPYMTLWEARKLKEMHLDLTGAAYWYIDRNPEEGQEVAYYPLDPTQMQLKTGANSLPAYYNYKDADGKVVQLDLDDVIYFRRTNPQNWFEGQSMVKKILYWSNAYAAGAMYNQNKLGNSTNIERIIYMGPVSEEQRSAAEEQLRSKYNGPKNAGTTNVMGGSVKPEVMQISPNQKDLDFVEGMKMLREDILVSFGIPVALLFPSATNANTKDSITLFQRDTLEPLMQQEKSVFNEQLLKKVSNSGNRAKKTTMYFDFEDVVDADIDSLVNQATRLYDSGIYTRNQALVRIGEEPIDGADEYKTEPQVVEPTEEEKSIRVKFIKLLEQQERTEFVQKNIQLVEDQEGIMHTSAEELFTEQFVRTINKIDGLDEITPVNVFDKGKEVELTKQTFSHSYAKVINNSNAVGNAEIQQKLYKTGNAKFANYKHKSISPQALSEIAKHVDYFANELTDTSAEKLRKIIARGVEQGFDTQGFKDSIKDIFNQYLDGQKNIDVLTRLGVYIPAVSIDTDGKPATADEERYRQMLSNITNARGDGEITKTEEQAALKALRGMLNPSDPVAAQVNDILSKFYNITADDNISDSRAAMIARTESTFARNLGFDDTYSDNPFVKGKRWNSLTDNDTRDSHRKINNKTIPIGESFSLDGGKMRFPGDRTQGAGAQEIVNCRCRITAELID